MRKTTTIMPTVDDTRSEVQKVEKQLRTKNKTLSELESKVKLFQRMLKSGISTPDVNSFVNKQASLKNSSKIPNNKLKKVAMKSKLDDVRAMVAR